MRLAARPAVPLRRRLLVAVTCLSLLGLSGAAVLTQRSAQQAVGRVQRADRDALQRTLGGLTQQYFNATFLASSSSAQSVAWTFGPADRAALDRLAASSPLTSYGAALVALDGRVLASSSGELPAADDPGFVPLRRDLQQGLPGLSTVMTVAGHHVVAFGVPVERDAVLRAVLLTFADIRVWPLQGYNQQLVVGDDAKPYVVDPAGTVAAAADTEALGAHLDVSLPRRTTDATVDGRRVVVSAAPGGHGWSTLTVQGRGAWSAGLTASREKALAVAIALLTLLLGLLIRSVFRARSTQQRLAEQRLYDPLTGLGQRAIFNLKLEAAFARRQRTGSDVGLLYCDLDGFKQVNDTCGHNAGDRLLQAVGSRLQESLRADDMAVRLGGDEFAVVVEGLGQTDLEDLVRRLVLAVEQPVGIGSTELVPRVSVGSVLATEADDATSLVHAADLAMYQVKSRRRAVVDLLPSQRSETAADSLESR